MMALPWLWSHLSLSLLVAAAMAAIVARRRVAPRWVPLSGLAIGMLLSVAPLGEVDVAGYFVAYSGELSFASLFYLAIYLFSQRSAKTYRVEDRDWDGLRVAWLFSGLALYVSALGGRGFDLYSLGFGTAMMGVAVASSAGLAIGGRWLEAVLLLGILWAWQLQLSGGANFWDYAIDPFIFIGSLARILWWMPAAVASSSGIKWGWERKLS